MEPGDRRVRTAFFVALAFFAGLFLAALAFSDAGAPGSISGRTSVLSRIESLGANDARGRLDVGRAPMGGSLGAWNFDLMPGDRRQYLLPDAPLDLLAVRATVQLTEGFGGGSGEWMLLVDPRECRGGTIVAPFRVDTTNGVDFEATEPFCE